MRVPSYRKHASGQARVTINGKDYLLGKYGSSESKEAYGRLIAEYSAGGNSQSFGKTADLLKMDDLLLSFLLHSKVYYAKGGEHYQYQLAARPVAELYGNFPGCKFGPAEFRAVREWWLKDPKRSRQYVNKQMKRVVRIIKWAVGAGMMPTENYTQIKCVDPLKCGRTAAPESTPITSVDAKLVKATIPHLTQVLANMVRFQQLVGCRPGELVKITPSMVDRSGKVWTITLREHKTAYRGKVRTLYIGPRAQRILKPYLLRGADAPCFSPIESEKQRRQAKHEARVTPLKYGNRPGTNVARKPRREPGIAYTTNSYSRAIKYACQRAKLDHWHPNQLRHSAATEIRKQFGLEAAQVILGHSGADITQVYAEKDASKAIEVARRIG